MVEVTASGSLGLVWRFLAVRSSGPVTLNVIAAVLHRYWKITPSWRTASRRITGPDVFDGAIKA